MKRIYFEVGLFRRLVVVAVAVAVAVAVDIGVVTVGGNGNTLWQGAGVTTGAI